MKREEQKKLTRGEKFAQMRSDFSNFLYKKEADEPAVVMGRTALSWGKIGLFFFVYYACLASFFAAMFAIAFSTMPDIKDGPKYTSLIADKPVLLVMPGGVGPYKKDRVDGIKKNYESILHAYRDTQCYDKNPCASGGSYRAEGEEKQCGFNLTSLGPCAPNSVNPNSTFGFADGTPCLYLRLSKIYGWKPEPYNSGKYIKLSCSADDSASTIVYYPPKDQAFPISFWPFRGESAWRTPIAAIQVHNNTREVKIKCRALADNIELSDTYKLKRGATGQVEFTVAAS